jgi:pimeloyl-ACP methyl ester carboxylesterase
MAVQTSVDRRPQVEPIVYIMASSTCQRIRGWFLLCSTLLVAILVSQAGMPAAQAPGKAGDMVIGPSTLTTPETGPVQFELGTLYVPENRSDPKSRVIGLGFARFKALQGGTAPPTFHLPGGPGGSYLASLKPDARGLGPRLQELALYRRVGDVVLVDQRGASERGDVLRFSRPLAPRPLDRPGTLAADTAATIEAARAVVADFASKGIDLRGYTVLECADDVNDLRRALGYERVTLVATSFGSQWSFAIMRRHPEIVARALLSGVEPLDHGFDMPSHVLAAVHRMWWEAEQDPKLKPYVPVGGLMAAAREIAHRLAAAPLRVTIKAAAPAESATIV